MTNAQKLKLVAKHFGVSQKRMAELVLKATDRFPDDLAAQTEYILLACIEDPRELQRQLDNYKKYL